MPKIKVGILGATGMVGQRFIALLENHPFFEVAELAASERSAGKNYEEAVGDRWKIPMKMPDYIKNMPVKECKPNLECKLVFSGLDSSIAGPIEQEFRAAGYIVSSNSKNHRMNKDVPLLIPEVNAEHLAIVEAQKKRYNGGFIITNPNCTTIGAVLALAPIHKKFGIKKLFITTMQALSGAGFKGFDLDIQDNIIPFIGGEEEKCETEPLKILGELKNGKFVKAKIRISAQCNRVNVMDGHTECLTVKLDKKPGLEEFKEAFREFDPLKGMNLPSAPHPPIILKEEEDRPQPKYDRELGKGHAKGMPAVIGRIRKDPILDYRFIVLSHNTIRGAAGAAILNAELMKEKGLLR